ncbi:hypothetical protein SODALDRAFT_131331 [Sodiomyces alkalinus F11]|uniref:Uncharacterized protein n=1 Tax=Sodiomyces alkalinus (strain CBS 110278 / VKM F-3762 / F11) TaxID=1314773 RepID=A0A3N2PYK4_SODAK|nr:hypothetical protein SODALDRAFT_131331 [Sodiomyces alkalinus F11]ROT39508.1 hypothetical protein SODALDRAFT_131331 [Sodiomyces alkalinus F11]
MVQVIARFVASLMEPDRQEEWYSVDALRLLCICSSMSCSLPFSCLPMSMTMTTSVFCSVSYSSLSLTLSSPQPFPIRKQTNKKKAVSRYIPCCIVATQRGCRVVLHCPSAILHVSLAPYPRNRRLGTTKRNRKGFALSIGRRDVHLTAPGLTCRCPPSGLCSIQ